MNSTRVGGAAGGPFVAGTGHVGGARHSGGSAGRSRSWVAVLVVTLLALLGWAPTAAAADIGGQLTNIAVTFKQSGTSAVTETSGAKFSLTYDACVPGGAQSGDTFTVTLPAPLSGWPSGFPIANPSDASDVWMNVTIVDRKVTGGVVTPGVATFTLTDSGQAWAATSAGNGCFTSFFGGALASDVKAGDHPIEVRTSSSTGGTTTPAGSITVGPAGSTSTVKPWKSMWFDDGDQCRTSTFDCISANVNLPLGDNGVITVRDTAGPNWVFNCERALGLGSHVYTPDFSSYSGAAVTDKSPLVRVSCTSEELVFTVNTSALADPTHQRFIVSYGINARTPGRDGLVTYSNTAVLSWNGGGQSLISSVKSTYAGGAASGAALTLVKRDAVGHHAPTAAGSIELPDGSTGLVFSIRNNGTQALTNLRVTDAVTSGSGAVSALACVFPGGSKGTASAGGVNWAGPLAPGASFECTATLTGVVGPHEDTASVTGIGDGGTPIGATDTYNAHRPVGSVTLTKAWAEGAVEGDAVTLTAGSGTGASIVGGATTAAVSTGLLGGDTIDLAEVFTTGAADGYTAAYTCSADGLIHALGELGASFTMPATPIDVTCTVTNTPVPQPIDPETPEEPNTPLVVEDPVAPAEPQAPSQPQAPSVPASPVAVAEPTPAPAEDREPVAAVAPRIPRIVQTDSGVIPSSPLSGVVLGGGLLLVMAGAAVLLTGRRREGAH